MTVFRVTMKGPDDTWCLDTLATQEKTGFFQAYPLHMTDPDLRMIYCELSLMEIERQVTLVLGDVTSQDAIGPYNKRASLAYRRFLTDLQTWRKDHE